LSLKSDLVSIADDANAMLALLAFNAQTSFRVEGVDLDIPAALIPQALKDKLTNDFNSALTRVKTKAAGLPNPV
jgi:hypothetical protein